MQGVAICSLFCVYVLLIRLIYLSTFPSWRVQVVSPLCVTFFSAFFSAFRSLCQRMASFSHCHGKEGSHRSSHLVWCATSLLSGRGKDLRRKESDGSNSEEHVDSWKTSCSGGYQEECFLAPNSKEHLRSHVPNRDNIRFRVPQKNLARAGIASTGGKCTESLHVPSISCWASYVQETIAPRVGGICPARINWILLEKRIQFFHLDAKQQEGSARQQEVATLCRHGNIKNLHLQTQMQINRTCLAAKDSRWKVQ